MDDLSGLFIPLINVVAYVRRRLPDMNVKGKHGTFIGDTRRRTPTARRVPATVPG